MPYDLIIRDGRIIDGSGLPGYFADVAIADGKIAAIGKVGGSAKETIVAEGHIVAPGFIDAHTHMDAQIFWDPLGTSSCWHGVTSVVMGNCGFSLAPCAEKHKDRVIRNLQRAEDISAEAMQAGIRWSWETFPQYLETIERLPKGINYSAYVGHSALRIYVMGERAFSEKATSEDLVTMKRELRDAIKAGAIGFSTSRTRHHQMPDGRPVASYLASWEEVRELVGVMGDLGSGVFELAQEDIEGDPDLKKDYLDRLQNLALETRVPTTFGVGSMREAPHNWRPYYQTIDETIAAGGKMLAQNSSRWVGSLLSFETTMPFDKASIWSELRKLPLPDQEAALRNRDSRNSLLNAAREHMKKPETATGAEARKPDFDYLFVLDKPLPPYRSIAEIAKDSHKDPFEAIIDIALQKHLKQFFIQPFANEDETMILAMMLHPRSAVTFSDSGAHLSQMMDSSIQTHLLGHWVRQRRALTLESAVRKLTYELASFWGLPRRGIIREGNFADIVIFDPEEISPAMPTLEYDLPAGARRLKQKSVGIKATIVNGEVLMRNSEHTGALPGTLIQGRPTYSG